MGRVAKKSGTTREDWRLEASSASARSSSVG
jgi:hypothetical protein